MCADHVVSGRRLLKITYSVTHRSPEPSVRRTSRGAEVPGCRSRTLDQCQRSTAGALQRADRVFPLHTLRRVRLRVRIEGCGPLILVSLRGPPSRRSPPPRPFSRCVAAARVAMALPSRRTGERTRARRRLHPRAGAGPAADRRAVVLAEAETARPRPEAETVRPRPRGALSRRTTPCSSAVTTSSAGRRSRPPA